MFELLLVLLIAWLIFRVPFSVRQNRQAQPDDHEDREDRELAECNKLMKECDELVSEVESRKVKPLPLP